MRLQVIAVASTSFEDCHGPHDLSSAHSISGWESKSTTCAEQAVIGYLTKVPSRYRDKTLLHVGIGNGALFGAMGAELRTFTGITISRPELDQVRTRFKDAASARTLLANKHDERFFPSIGGDFDLIVDVNLKSFACCEKHFRTTMQFFASSLTPGGTLMTAQSGLEFGWAGNFARAHTPGAATTAVASDHRVLGADGLAKLSVELGLALHSLPVEATSVCKAETLWLLEKA